MEFLGRDRIKFNQAVNLLRVTTAERNLLTGLIDGDKIHNIDIDKEQFYEGGVWITLGGGGGIDNTQSIINALIFG